MTRRIAPKTTLSPKALKAQQERKAALLSVLRIRGAPINRKALAESDPSALRTPAFRAYARAAEHYLATHNEFFWKEADAVAARHIPKEDLYQAAYIGGLLALDKFDESLIHSGKVTSFLSYAHWWVRCEIGRLLDEESLVRIPTAARKSAQLVRETMISLISARVASLPEDLTDEAIVAALPPKSGLSAEKVSRLRRIYLGNDHVDATYPQTIEDDDPQGALLLQAIADTEAEVDDDSIRKQQTEVVFAAVAALSPRQRRLVLETYGLPLDDEAKAAVVPTRMLRDAALKAALGRLRGELEA
ncbi:MAG: sigma-70 family RNA polymerase sigma factor [Desulfurellales bacterium]|nr:MAG: sigma-70 family RNA polymerase sigma factor [Desulfurellales bacterium]